MKFFNDVPIGKKFIAIRDVEQENFPLVVYHKISNNSVIKFKSGITHGEIIHIDHLPEVTGIIILDI